MGMLRRESIHMEGGMDMVAGVSPRMAGAAFAPTEEHEDAGESAPPMVQATVRQAFADTAVWLPTLTTGADGVASAAIEMPENLTTWKLNAWAMTKGTKVGQASTEAVTTKDLLVRLQAPRFFVERDEVVISANVHNYLDTAKTVEVWLEIPEDLMGLDGSAEVYKVRVKAGGEARVDFRVKR